MNKYYYDLHIHSCLSPCGDNESTPASIAGMGVLNGLNIMALTDHNSCKNCEAFFKAAKRHGIIPIAGMELTTAEDIHVVFLFEELEDALRFDEYVDTKRLKIKNRPDIFGEQLIVNEEDEVIGHEDNLLINATTISLDETVDLAKKFGGICYPAHIDRESNGLLATLGFFPPEPVFSCVEIKDSENAEKLICEHNLQNKTVVVSSDAHYLWDIKEQSDYFTLDDEPYSSAKVRKELFKLLRGNE